MRPYDDIPAREPTTEKEVRIAIAETKRNAHLVIRFSRWGKEKLHFYPIDAFLAELTWFGAAALTPGASATAFLDVEAASRFTAAQMSELQATLDEILARAAVAMPTMEHSSPGVNEHFREWAKAQLAPFEALLRA